MNADNNDYLKQRYRHGGGNYVLMLIVATIFFALGISLVIQIFIHRAPLGLIFCIPCLGFGIGFAFHAISTLVRKYRSCRLVDNGKRGTGRVIRVKGVSYKGGNSRSMYSIVFSYTNDGGKQRTCKTEYAFYGDEIRGVGEGRKVTINYNETFAIVVDFIKTFQEASEIAKQNGGKEFLNNDRKIGTVQPKLNKFLSIAKVATIALIIIVIALIITSFVTDIMTLFYIGIGLLGAGFIVFAVTFAVLYFGKNK